jgi:hypothetical protein
VISGSGVESGSGAKRLSIAKKAVQLQALPLDHHATGTALGLRTSLIVERQVKRRSNMLSKVESGGQKIEK